MILNVLQQEPRLKTEEAKQSLKTFLTSKVILMGSGDGNLAAIFSCSRIHQEMRSQIPTSQRFDKFFARENAKIVLNPT